MAKESATAKDAQFLLISVLPDVCFTPSKPPHGVPVPYSIMHDMSKSLRCSPSVFFRGKPAYLHETSYVDKVTGDEPGAGKGVISGTHTQTSRSRQYSSSVYINGKRMVRTGDMVWMNRSKFSRTGNTVGIIVQKTKPAPSRRSSTPPVVLATQAERDFAAWRWVYSVANAQQENTTSAGSIQGVNKTFMHLDEIETLIEATIDAGLRENVSASLAAASRQPFVGVKESRRRQSSRGKHLSEKSRNESFT